MTTKRKATGITKNTFRSAYNLGNEDYSQSFTDGLTEQHHTDTCDINKILAQFMETGIMPNTNANPQYGDVTDVDFTQMQNQLAIAKTLFEELPEQVKARFNNEMHTFLHFAENPNNLPELVDMGLAVKNERLAQALQAQDANSVLPGSLDPGKEIASDKPQSGASETVAT
jgi:hypothetical protein